MLDPQPHTHTKTHTPIEATAEINNKRTIALKWTAANATGGLGQWAIWRA